MLFFWATWCPHCHDEIRLLNSRLDEIKAKGINVTFDFQEVNNPAYNRDRGPVSIAAVRLHLEF